MTARVAYRPELDGLRTVAVAAVILFHLSHSYLPAGLLGVNVFFTLSGFIITLVLLREWEATGRINRSAFYLRRLLRLGPALVAVVLLAAPIYWHLGLSYSTEAITSLTYTNNIYHTFFASDAHTPLGHIWSLAVEEQFYLLWAPLLAFLLVRQARIVAILATLIVLAVIGRAVLTQGATHWNFYSLPTSNADQLLIGALVAVAFNSRRLTDRMHRVGSLAAVGWGGAAVLAVAMIFGGDTDWRPWYFGGFTVVGLAAAAVIAHIYARPTGRLGRGLSLPPMVWLGKRSYGIYLYHFPVIFLLQDQTSSKTVIALLAITATVLIAAASYRWLERPALLLKERFESVRTRVAVAH